MPLRALRIGRLVACAVLAALLCACPRQQTAGVQPSLAWNSHVPLSPSEKTYLESLPPIRLGVDPLWAPIAFVDSRGRLDGISANYVNFLKEALHLRFDLVPTRSWGETTRLANAGRIDFVVAASPFDGLAPGFGLSTPYVRYPLVIVTRETAPFIGGLDDLEGARVAIVGDVQTARVRFTGPPDLHLVTVASAEDGLKAVAQGRAFAYIGNLGVIDRIVRERYAGTLRVAAPADRIQDLSFAVAPRLAPLLPLVDRVLAAIPETEREYVQNSWLSTRLTLGVAPRTLWLVLAPVGTLTLLFLAVLWFNMQRLREEVRQRRRTERELVSETRVKVELTQNLPSVVFQLSFVRDRRPSFALLFANRRADELARLHPGEPMDAFAAFLRALDPSQRDGLTRMFLRSARSKEPVRTEFMLRQRSVAPAWFHVEAAPREREGGGTEWSGYLHDVTESKQAQAALVAAKHDAEDEARARDLLIATVSHEIRLPMSGIVSILQLLDHDRLQPDDRHLIGMASDAAESLLLILNDILDFAKSESGELSLEHASMSIEEIVRHAVGLVMPEIERKGLTMNIDCSPKVAAYHTGDARRLGQVLLNVLGNAAKFTESGTVTLSVDVLSESFDRQVLSMRVADTGIGIGADDQARMFSPFSQVRGTQGGTGLGLAICKRLIEQMGGTIALESQLGVGTTVAITLDLIVDRAALRQRACESAPGRVPEAASDGAGTRAPRILLVEDRLINREVLRRQLASLHVFDCDVADNGLEALAACEGTDYAMIITDCAMPVLGGAELMARIRRREKGGAHRTALIALTADATLRQRSACIEAGADAFFVKPLPLGPLRELLERYGLIDVPSRAMTKAGAAIAPNADLSRQLRRTFSADMRTLVALSLADDSERARDLAHSIAGTAAWFQLSDVAQAAARLQDCLDRNGAPQAALRALHDALARAIGEHGESASASECGDAGGT